MDQPLAGSLCTGYGGLDAAVCALLGVRVAWVCETDPNAARIIGRHLPGVPNHGDITACYPRWTALVAALADLDRADMPPAERGYRRAELINAAGDLTAEHAVDCLWERVGPVDILTAGFPCQGWSDAGLRRGTADPRDLWPAVAHAVRVVRPRLVVLENVAGFARRRAGVGRAADELAAVGYDLRWTRVRASDVGAPHLRERWFAVAWPAADIARGSVPHLANGGHPGRLPLGTRPAEGALPEACRPA